MSAEQILALLRDSDRAGAPEPSLLPWLVRQAAVSDLSEAATVVASVGSRLSAWHGGWPVVGDAAASLLAGRDQSAAGLLALANVLPPIAGYFGRDREFDWAELRPDAIGYAVLAGVQVPRDIAALTVRPLWAGVLQAATVRTLPPLADLRSLAILVAGPAASSGARESDDDAAYLLPYRLSGAADQLRVIQAIHAAARTDRHWLTAAMIARVAPYLDESGRAELRLLAEELPPTWAGHLAELLAGPIASWSSDYHELAASHPAIARLEELATSCSPDVLARMCVSAVADIAEQYAFSDGWEVDDEGWEQPADLPHFYRIGEHRQHHLGIGPGAPARHANLYLAESGSDQPVAAAPLRPGGSYDVCCNIGPHDERSLLDQDAADFPEDLLPDAPLQLRAVLFVEGRATTGALFELPAQGASNWVRLVMPALPVVPTVITADLGIYYDVAAVLMYSLTIPVGGATGRGPEVRLRHRLSRSLADLSKLAGRNLSIVVPDTTSSLYVNGLSFAPQAFAHNPDLVRQAALSIRTVLYNAHFIAREEDNPLKSRYRVNKNGGHEKPLDQFIKDFSQLARWGASLYNQLFPDRRWLANWLRDEAEAHGRPPIIQVASFGRQLLPIPWAAVYDLKIAGEIADYEPCPSIKEIYGSGELNELPSARCPYENEHRSGGKWRLNQLCPWGMWGLSTIIEHPPSAWHRDLEQLARHQPGLPTVMVGYDTSLNTELRRRHLHALERQLGKALLEPQVARRTDLQTALELRDMDVLYLYCHVNDDPSYPPGVYVPAIQLGPRHVSPDDIAAWAEERSSDSSPLAIINGCRSLEIGSGSLANFVDAFINRGFSGVVGTETVIEQGLAGWAMEIFFKALDRLPVGEALRLVRWTMFKHGNVMGLGYTPYCLAGLALRPRVEEP